MSSLSLLLWILLGFAAQLGLFLGLRLWRHWQSYQRLRDAAPEAGPANPAGRPPAQEAAGWSGFRAFRVARRISEDPAQQICSFYLEAQDGQPLPSFRPGQFLTFRLDVPRLAGSGSEPIVRCYSLSDAPDTRHYRVSIKRLAAPPGSGHPPGRASSFFHDHVAVGTTLDIRAPSGHFVLTEGKGPLVLVAGGIGITPLLSMLEWCQAHQPGREIWFFHGVRNSRESAFAAQLKAIAAANPNVHLRRCFSDPLPGDQAGKDFDHHGRVDIALLRLELPLKSFDYYVCGPAPMMAALLPALADWGVPDARIHFEAFGPASLRRRMPQAPDIATPPGELRVTFARSGRQAPWSGHSASLLEFAESLGIAIDSGCRAGSCGSCQTSIVSGEVAYRQAPDYDPAPGTCLMCVSTPSSDLTLEA